MKTKKASKTMIQCAEFTRRVGIRCGALPQNFPKMANIHFHSVEDKKLDFGGFGGAMPLNGKMVPFVLINVAHNPNAVYFMAALAHEFLHIAQYRKEKGANHGNEFRKNCKKFALACGIEYYLIMGYDAPSESTAKAKAKNHEKWLNGFRGRDEIKTKAFQEI